MSIVVTCKGCGKKLKAPDKLDGKKGKCPGCGNAITIQKQPLDEASAPAAEPDARGLKEEKPKLKMLMVEGFSDISIVRFTTSRVLDGSNVNALAAEFDYIVKELYAVKLIVNFEKVKFMSSAVLGKLITLNKMVAAEKGKLKFCCIDPTIMDVFKIMKLDKILKIYDTEEKAVESFGKWFG